MGVKCFILDPKADTEAVVEIMDLLRNKQKGVRGDVGEEASRALSKWEEVVRLWFGGREAEAAVVWLVRLCGSLLDSR